MKLSEIFNQLTFGELAQINLGGSEGGVGIPEDEYERVLAHVNLGLTALHRRFNLREGRVTVLPYPGMHSYRLHSQYQEGNRRSKEPVRFIPKVPVFRDDVLRIERVYAGGEELPLNDELHPLSVTTPNYNTLVLPNSLDTPSITAVYRASHPEIVLGLGMFRPEITEVELPPAYLEALLLFVASRVMNPIGSSDGFHEGNNYAAKFEAECRRLEDQNFQVGRSTTNDRLRRNGWV